MKIAFDWQGTLDVNLELRTLAQILMEAGSDVWIISAMPVGREGEREKQIEQENSYGIPYKVVYHELENYDVAAGEAKIKVMKELGIELLIDDNAIVADTVRKAGIKVLLI